MENNADQELVKEAEQLGEEKSRLFQVTQDPIVKALVSLNPVAAPFMSILSDRLQKQQEVRLQSFIVTLAKEIQENKNNIKSKIDEEFFKSQEFAPIIEAVLLEVSRSADKNKLRLLREFLQASILRSRPDITWQELFLKYLGQLAGTHLVVLEIFYEVQHTLSRSDRLGQAIIPGRIPFDIKSSHSRIPTLDDNLLRITCIDLSNIGLLVDWHHLSRNSEFFQEQYCLTDNGLLFMRYIKGEWKQKPNEPVIT